LEVGGRDRNPRKEASARFNQTFYEPNTDKVDQMETQTLTVPNITCGHCVAAIQNELNEIQGVQGVEGDPASKRITVRWQAPATLTAIRDKLAEINYPASQ
jgi:copper chaperone CopZ